jgi:hypothetical protein
LNTRMIAKPPFLASPHRGDFIDCRQDVFMSLALLTVVLLSRREPCQSATDKGLTPKHAKHTKTEHDEMAGPFVSSAARA